MLSAIRIESLIVAFEAPPERDADALVVGDAAVSDRPLRGTAIHS